MKKLIALLLALTLAVSLTACGGGNTASDGKVNLTFQIWDGRL